MANKNPSPYKGVPKSEWGRIKAEQAQKRESAMVDEPKQPEFDPAIVRETLQAPERKADAVFPQRRVEADIPPRPQEWSEDNIPPNLFSGDQKHLEVMGKNGSFTDPIPGYKLYWFDAKNGIRIQMALRSGYTFVEKDEVLLNEGLEGSDDLGTHVRKIGNIYGGETDDGLPQYMYLMKKPLWLVDKHNTEMERVNQKYEEMLRNGLISKNPQQDRQFAGGSDLARAERSGLPPIQIRNTLNR